jgi:hypothetical protein
MGYRAIRVDTESNADEFWTELADQMPGIAQSLERNGCAVVSEGIFSHLDRMGGFTGEPAPLVDCGSEGPAWDEVTASEHEVIDG